MPMLVITVPLTAMIWLVAAWGQALERRAQLSYLKERE